ncbi:MAG: AraC family transcriptional regulator [Bacteroidetes bacterium]|nr:AraC family transcriptional regulator [Bacteroidota bacterium]
MVEIFDNIRKIYIFSDACPELAEHIEFFSESSFEATRKYIAGESFSVKMFASWTPTFYINLGAPYYISVGNERHFVRADQDILILRNSIVERYNTPLDNIFTVKFQPGGLEAVLGISQLKCVDKLIDLDTVLPRKLIRELRKPISFEERCAMMQQYLLDSFIKHQQGQDHYLRFVHDCIDRYNNTDKLLNTSAMAERMFVSSKTINRYFNRVVGISPKSYFSLLRARAALTSYVSHKKGFSPYDFGYYDMSHFYREMVSFTGQRVTRV